MPDLIARLQALKSLAPHRRLSILLDALDRADPEELPHLCRILLESRDRNAVIGVVRQFHRLTPAGRHTLRDAACNVAPALHDIIAAGGAHAAVNALALVRDREDLALLPIVSDLLEAPSEQLTREAALVLRGLLRPWSDRPVTRERSPETLRRIDDALARALETYRHHREANVLHAAALHAPWAGPKLEVLLGEDDHPAMLAMRSVVERVDDPDIRRNLIRWTTSTRLSRAVLRWVHRVASPEEFSDVFQHAHLLLNPARRSAFRGVDRANACGPSPLAVGSIGARSQRDLARWVDTLPLTAKERIARASMIFATAQRIPRLRIMPRLLAYDDALRQRTMAQAVRDHDHVVARQALRHGFRQPTVDDDVLSAAISRDEHTFVRRATLRTSLGHERAYFAAFDHLDRTTARVLARHHLRHNREPFLAALRAKLDDRDVTRITMLIDLMRGVRLVPEFEPALIAMTASTSARISASAVIALRDGAMRERLDALRAALLHDDGRVRANAVEALTAISIRERQGVLADVTLRWLTELAEDDHNRLRGNAVRALLRTDARSAPRLLHAMLEDKRPLHRVSGLWAATTGGDLSIVEVVRNLCASDPVPEIRTRAHAARRLLEVHVEAHVDARAAPR